MTEVPQYLREQIEDILCKKSIQWTVPDCGLSSAHRFTVQLEDKSKVFVKAATDEETESWLRNEHLALSTFTEEFIPTVIAWIDTAKTRPVLITQDLSNAYWPASHKGVIWRKGDFERLFESIQKLSTVNGHPAIPNLKNERANIWAKIATNPSGFLRLNLCSENWFKTSIDFLIDAESKVKEVGNILVHGDIRSDNICINQSQVIFVDWSNARNGSPDHDLANLLPSLHLEGGPNPYLVMPFAASQASYICATHIRRLSNSNSMPSWLIKVFKKLIAIELEWAAKCLNLDKPDGIKWNSL
jgi:thiamine kinase-like enzyme